MINIQGNKICLRDWLITDLEEYEFWRQPGHKWQEFDGLWSNYLFNEFTKYNKTLTSLKIDEFNFMIEVN